MRSKASRRRSFGQAHGPPLRPRPVWSSGAGGATSRFQVPEELVRLIEFGLDHPELVRADYWARVEQRAVAMLTPLLPEGEGLRLRLDPRRDEIVATVAR